MGRGRASERRHGPWLGFAVGGAALWGLFVLARPVEPAVIEVDAATVAALRNDFERRRGRPPHEAELDVLVDDWVEGELLVREARAHGLDRADPIVRRRLAQKMRFVLEEAEPIEDPGDPALAQWLHEHAERYRRAPRRGFTHVFVAGHTAEAEAAARAWAQRLEQGADPAGRGDAFAHGPRQGPAEAAALAERYGEGLAQVVAAAPRDRWVVAESSFGWHALRVDVERPGGVPALVEIRARVLADWQAERRADNLERGLEALRQRARVEVAR